MSMIFADKLAQRVEFKRSRLLVGLDPHWDKIPEPFKDQRGGNPSRVLRDYFAAVIEATEPYAAAYKPQIAFFEQFGPAGLQALQDLLALIHAQGDLVIMDAKRNDIGSTVQAYGRAFFGDRDHEAPFPCDGLTVNAYLGSDGILPLLKHESKGLFVLVKTSNPSSGDFQDLVIEGGQTLAEMVARAVDRWSEPTLGTSGYGNVGAVIGATYPDHMDTMRALLPHSWLLVPGYGAQGGDPRAIRAAFHASGLGALINASRSICFPAEPAGQTFDSVAQAAQSARDEINRLARSS